MTKKPKGWRGDKKGHRAAALKGLRRNKKGVRSGAGSGWMRTVKAAGVSIWKNKSARRTLQVTKGINGWYLSTYLLGGDREGNIVGKKIDIYKNRGIAEYNAKKWMDVNPKGLSINKMRIVEL